MRNLLLAVACVITMVSSSAAAAADARLGGPRIRPQDSRIAQVLKEGPARSSTFKSLVERIESGDVIVYIAINPVLKSSLAGAMTFMTSAGGFRYLRASISLDQTFDQMIATVAHELQHVVEVIDDRTVADEKSLVALYRRIGEPSRVTSSWETVAAQQAGYQVRRELVAVPAPSMVRGSGNSQS